MSLCKRRIIILRFSIGIDIGSVGVKAVLFDGGIADAVLLPTGWSPKESALQALEKMFCGTGDVSRTSVSVVATGYGRKSVSSAKKRVTEITCHARGVRWLAPNARTVLDIGGQDSKVILLGEDGSVEDFAMNDKCAAGTGRFLQMMSHVLDYDIGDFGAVDPWGEFQPISSMCAVFAETEVVGHLARGVDRESLVRGLLRSIASRSAAMLARIGMREPLFFSGGVSRSPTLVRLIGRETDCEILTSDRSQFAGAIGAALIGWEDEERSGNHT